MSFRRGSKAIHQQSRQWAEWLAVHVELLRAAGLPPSVLRSRDDWEYLLRYGYHCGEAYPDIDFHLEELTPSQKVAFQNLLEQTLSKEERQRGNAGWHFVCPPSG